MLRRQNPERGAGGAERLIFCLPLKHLAFVVGGSVVKTAEPSRGGAAAALRAGATAEPPRGGRWLRQGGMPRKACRLGALVVKNTTINHGDESYIYPLWNMVNILLLILLLLLLLLLLLSFLLLPFL